MRRRSTALLLVGSALAGCAGGGALDPAGREAREVEALWWLTFWLGTAVTVVVVGLLLLSLFRRGEGDRRSRLGRGISLVLVGGVAVPIVILAVLFVASLSVDQAARGEERDGDVVVQVVGRQWFWDLYYEEPALFRTSNELHIPVDRPVRLELTTSDVIHSFWVPRLAGKLDLMPGRSTRLTIEAEEPGVYYGQCAEFCGIQHANMQFLVIAHEEEEFEEWLLDAASEADPPDTLLEQEGQGVFFSSGCVYCHTVRGTPATGEVGPDLTNIGDRRTLAAATIPNTRGHMGGWVLDPQTIKPGNLMPPTNLTGPQLQALLAYLESLE